jgi:hypothetical protein
MMSRTYPAEAKQALTFWRAALVLSAIGGGFFVATVETPAQRSAARATARAAEIRQEIANQAGAQWTAWLASGNCQTPQSPEQRADCEAISKSRVQQFVELQSIERGEWRDSNWGLRSVIGSSQFSALGGSETIRRMLVLALSIAAVAGAGILGRLAVLASAESYRLAEGTASSVLVAPGLPAVDDHPAPVLAPVQVFDMWFQRHVRYDPSGRLTLSTAYDDYVQTCALHGLPAMGREKFGDLLTWKAENSGGRIVQENSGDSSSYAGLALAGDHGNLPVVDIGSDGGTVVALRRS